MFLSILKFVLWQNIEKPKSKSEFLHAAIAWLFVGVLVILAVVGTVSLRTNLFSKLLILVYLLPNFLLIGPSWTIALMKEAPAFSGWFMLDRLSIFFSLFVVVTYLKRRT